MPKLKNPKAKGSRAEHKSKKWLEARGYLVSRAAGSLGLFDLVAVGKNDVLLVQVKGGKAKVSKQERVAIDPLRLAPFVVKCWHSWPDRAKEPVVHYFNSHLEAEVHPENEPTCTDCECLLSKHDCGHCYNEYCKGKNSPCKHRGLNG